MTIQEITERVSSILSCAQENFGSALVIQPFKHYTTSRGPVSIFSLSGGEKAPWFVDIQRHRGEVESITLLSAR